MINKSGSSPHDFGRGKFSTLYATQAPAKTGREGREGGVSWTRIHADGPASIQGVDATLAQSLSSINAYSTDMFVCVRVCVRVCMCVCVCACVCVVTATID